MELAEKGWIVLGTPFRCSGLPAEERRALEALLQGFPAAGSPCPEAVELRLEPGDGGKGFVLTDAGGARWDLTDSGAPVSSHVEYRLVDGAIQRAHGRWILHAGAVVAPAGTCLLVGESGAGKTSLTLWLWANGFRLVTDDLCPIAREALLPEVFPRALHMDGDYSPRLLEKIPPRPPGYPADYYPFPAAAGGGAPPAVTRLLVIERGPAAGGELTPLSQAEAAHHLLKAVIKSPGFDYAAALDGMLRLAAQCRASRLRSSTPEGAGARAVEWLGGP